MENVANSLVAFVQPGAVIEGWVMVKFKFWVDFLNSRSNSGVLGLHRRNSPENPLLNGSNFKVREKE